VQRQGLQPRKVKPIRELPQNDQMEQARQLLRSQNYQNAHAMLMNLAQQGHAEAMFFLALMNDRGSGVPQDVRNRCAGTRDRRWPGWSDSMFNLGQKYHKGEGVEPIRSRRPICSSWSRQPATPMASGFSAFLWRKAPAGPKI
jgi:hypothetical protein